MIRTETQPASELTTRPSAHKPSMVEYGNGAQRLGQALSAQSANSPRNQLHEKEGGIMNTLTSTLCLIAIGASIAVGMTSMNAGAKVIVNNTQSSGEILAAAGNDSATMSYNNNGDFLAAVVTVSGNDGVTRPVPTPTVSFGPDNLIQQASGQRRAHGWSSIFYLADPTAGAQTFSVDFGASAVSEDNGAWEFGVLSLSNVDETDPIASSDGWDRNQTHTFTSSVPGGIDTLDLLLVGSAAEYEHPDPHWHVPTDSQTSFYYNGSPTGANRHEYNAMYANLADGDLSGTSNDELLISQAPESRLGGYSGVVFNGIIPEPATLTLLGVGGLLLGNRRRS